MSTIAVGKKPPDFTLPATGGKQVKLSGLKGQYVVLYFYPKDDTPGCTLEGRDFNAQYAKFIRKNAVILGVSRDNLKSHEKFCDKFGFKFDLLSDEDEKVCTLYGVMKEKNMYGRKVWGIERSTFLIDPKGLLLCEWRKVQVKDHAAEVLEALSGTGGKAAAGRRPAKKKKKTAPRSKRR